MRVAVYSGLKRPSIQALLENRPGKSWGSRLLSIWTSLPAPCSSQSCWFDFWDGWKWDRWVSLAPLCLAGGKPCWRTASVVREENEASDKDVQGEPW